VPTEWSPAWVTAVRALSMLSCEHMQRMQQSESCHGDKVHSFSRERGVVMPSNIRGTEPMVAHTCGMPVRW